MPLPFTLYGRDANALVILVQTVKKDVIGTTDIVDKGTEIVVFRTCEQERNQLVFQMGTSDAVRALKADELVCRDVAAIDVNMGCPKAFSIYGGMGAALLTKLDLIHDVSCKIHLLNSTRDTVELAKRFEKAGSLFLLFMEVLDRPRDPANWSEITHVVDALSIAVIANDDVFEYQDFQNIRTVTGTSSVMVARGALWNASIFSLGGTPVEEVKKEYVGKSILWDHDIKSTKYKLKEMIIHYTLLELPEGKTVTKSESLADIARLYGERKVL